MFSKIILFLLLFNITYSELCQCQSDDNTDSLYLKAFNIIIKSECSSNWFLTKVKLKDEKVDYYLSTEILRLRDPVNIDTNSCSFYQGKGLYRKQFNVIDINEKLYNFNYLDEKIFLDTSQTTLLVFFTEMSDIYFIAEVYLFGYFPVIFVGEKNDFKKNVEYNKLYKNSSEYDLLARFLFIVERGEIKSYRCK